jgi:predicted dehydrogenase
MRSFVICGLGLIGRQRLAALLDFGINPTKISLYDPILDFDQDLKLRHFSKIANESELYSCNPSHVIVSTPHDAAIEIVRGFSNKGTHIMMEKPMGRNLSEAIEIWETVEPLNLNIGFNYRFMPGMKLLKQNLEMQLYGTLNSIRIDIGHGGSPKDLESWKLNLSRAGGGALLDPGIHVFDLLLYLFGCSPAEIIINGANKWAGFWNTGIEESVNVVGFCNKVPFTISISLVAWRTRFKVEVIGADAYSIINGRGRSEGPQVHTFGKRWGWINSTSQKDSETTQLLSQYDNSILDETKSWLTDKSNLATSLDGLKSMQLYDLISKKLDTHGSF